MGDGVRVWSEIPERLRETPVGEIWGIGQRHAATLASLGVETVAEFRDYDPSTLRRRFGVVLSRTWREVRGIPCLSIESVPPLRQQIRCSRSFGAPVSTWESVAESLSVHTQRAVEKLCRQGLYALSVRVDSLGNPFAANRVHHGAYQALPEPPLSYCAI